jgi:hypothetical protein
MPTNVNAHDRGRARVRSRRESHVLASHTLTPRSAPQRTFHEPSARPA